MKIAKEKLEIALTEYIKEQKTAEECIGFADGFNRAIELISTEGETERMVSAFYKVAETVDFSKPEHEGLWDIIYPFLKTNAELSPQVHDSSETKGKEE